MIAEKDTFASFSDLSKYMNGVWEDPVRWIQTMFRTKLWSKQRVILRAIRDNKLTSVASCNAAGKSFIAACAVLVYMESHAPGYVITTSSSWRGVKHILWPEIRRLISRCKMNLGGEILTTEWKRGPQWAAFGVSADVEENFAGFRTPGGVFIICDEASALQKPIYDAMMGLAAGHGSRVFFIGNPLRPEGPFFDTFTNPKWKTLSISAYETPNISGKETPIKGLATKDWIDDRKIEWGEGSAAYAARVLGKFPDSSEDTIVPQEWNQHIVVDEYPEKMEKNAGPIRLGVDVARYGSDRTVFLIRNDLRILFIKELNKKSTMTTTGWILRLMKEYDISPEHIYIDDCGVGGGVTDRLEEQGYAVTPVNNGAGADDKEQFMNKRAECYWLLRQALDPVKENSLTIPVEWAGLVKELHLIRYGYGSRGQIKIEEKKEVKKRLGRSPDLADALALTYDESASQVSFSTL